MDYNVDDIDQDSDDVLNDNLFFVDSLKKLRKELIDAASRLSTEECAGMNNRIMLSATR